MRKNVFFILLTVLYVLCGCGKKTHSFEIKEGKFLYDGEKVQLICGEMHYPRIPVEYWRDRMQRAKAMGLNTISAYVFWAVHEPQPGEFNFEGQADIARFVEIAAEEGLFVLLRPGPYVCAEFDFGAVARRIAAFARGIAASGIPSSRAESQQAFVTAAAKG